MTVKRIVSFLLLLAFVTWAFLAFTAVVPVSAQVPTSTPQNTVTPTPVDPDCPEGLPVGWGTYTPSPLWLLECEHCLNALTPTATFLPSVTPTHSGTGTPYPTFTATVTLTPTVTPIPQNGMECHHLEGANCWTGQVQSYEFTLQKTGFGNGNNFEMFNVHFPDTWSQAMVFFQYDLTTSWVDAHGSYLPYVKQDEWMGYHYNNQGTWLGGFPATGGGCVAGTSGSCVWTDSGNYALVMPPSGGMDFSVWWQNTNVDWPAGSTIVSGTVYVSVVGFPYTVTPTPAVTSTPVDTLSCGSVSSFDSGFGFELFVPDGEANCSMGWDQFGFLDYTVPAVQICLQPVQFGVIRLYGNDYEVGIYGLVGAVAFLYRFLKTI